MSLMRGYADDMELDTWLNDYIWPAEANLNDDYCYTGALLSCLEMIKTGTTCFNDMYFYNSAIAKAVEESGIRGILSYGMIDFGDEEKRENEFKESIQLIKNHNNTADGRIRAAFGPHAPYTASKELLIRAREEANKYQVPLHIHVGETQKEINDIKESTNYRPFEYLEDIGFLGEDVIAAHAVHLSDNEREIIKKHNVKIAHNPMSNMKLSSGIAPVADLLKRGICVGIGTDGSTSNNNLDMFQEMRTASLLQKVDTYDPTVLPAEEVISMATRYGAECLGWADEIGDLQVGMKADIILVDMHSVHLTPNRNPASHLVYSASGFDVDTTICNGKILMENKQVLILDEETVIQKAETTGHHLINEAQKQE